jgi:hypothetical protein
VSHDALVYMLIALVVTPLVGAFGNYSEKHIRPRAPRLADFLMYFFPHVEKSLAAMAPGAKPPQVKP